MRARMCINKYFQISIVYREEKFYVCVHAKLARNSHMYEWMDITMCVFYKANVYVYLHIWDDDGCACIFEVHHHSSPFTLYSNPKPNKHTHTQTIQMTARQRAPILSFCKCACVYSELMSILCVLLWRLMKNNSKFIKIFDFICEIQKLNPV